MKDRFRILIVDDELSNISILRHALESDYIVQISKNGHQALKIAQKSLPDLILLDIKMPEMDGYTVCSKLKSMAETRHIPIIFITSKTEYEDETKGFQTGAVDYIAKPFNPAIVKARVQTHIELKNHRDHLEKLVAERTRQLEIKSKDLEETNIALRVLLDQKDEAPKEVEENILTKINDLIMPLLGKMKSDQRPSSQKTYRNLIESNLNKLMEPLKISINFKYQDFTPTEIQIANMIREGKTTKEIATLLNLAMGTVTWYRDSIRDKLGLKNKKTTLKSHLLALQK